MVKDRVSLIRQVREAERITQADLGSRLGTTQSAVARLEAADANPRLNTLIRALEALGREVRIEAHRPEMDVEQLRAYLDLAPAERLRRHDAAARDVGALVTSAHRVPDVG